MNKLLWYVAGVLSAVLVSGLAVLARLVIVELAGEED